MTAVLVYHRVADYDAWRRVFDQIVASPMYDVVQSHRVWRGQDDPDLVIVMAQAGVDMASLEIHYVDEVAAGSH